MISEDIVQEATQVWVEYGKAICGAFGFKGNMLVVPLTKVLQTGNEGKVQRFIKYIRKQTLEIKNAKFVNERN